MWVVSLQQKWSKGRLLVVVARVVRSKDGRMQFALVRVRWQWKRNNSVVHCTIVQKRIWKKDEFIFDQLFKFIVQFAKDWRWDESTFRMIWKIFTRANLSWKPDVSSNCYSINHFNSKLKNKKRSKQATDCPEEKFIYLKHQGAE